LGEEFSKIDNLGSLSSSSSSASGSVYSQKLSKTLKLKCLSYFNHFHRALNLEPIRTQLETDTWRAIPDPANTIRDELYRELKLIASVRGSRNLQSTFADHAKLVRNFLSMEDRSLNPFRRAADLERFDIFQEVKQQHDDGNDSSSSSSNNSGKKSSSSQGGKSSQNNKNAAKKRDSDDDDDDDEESDEDEEEEDPETKKKREAAIVEQATLGPVITVVTINIIKNFGRYLKAMEILAPIVEEVYSAFESLYKFYVCNSYRLNTWHFANHFCLITDLHCIFILW